MGRPTVPWHALLSHQSILSQCTTGFIRDSHGTSHKCTAIPPVHPVPLYNWVNMGFPWDVPESHGNPIYNAAGWTGSVTWQLIHAFCEWEGDDYYLGTATSLLLMGLPYKPSGTVGQDGEVGWQSMPWDCETSHGNPL